MKCVMCGVCLRVGVRGMPLGTRLRSAWLALFASPAYAAVMQPHPPVAEGAASACSAFCRRPARSEYLPSPDRRHLACLRPRLPPSPPPPRAAAPPARSAPLWHGEGTTIGDRPRERLVFQRFRGACPHSCAQLRVSTLPLAPIRLSAAQFSDSALTLLIFKVRGTRTAETDMCR